MERITSLQNPRVKQVVKLGNRRERQASGLLTVEGIAEVALAIEGSLRPIQLFFCSELTDSQDHGLLDILISRGCEILDCSSDVLRKVSYREHPDGWFLVAAIPQSSLEDVEKKIIESGEPPFLILTEDLEKPGNFGAILRTADGVGVQGVISLEGRTDIHNPNVVRASKGTIFTLPVVEASNEEVLEWLRRLGVAIFAATPEKGVDYWDHDFRGPLAFVLGAENEGLSEFWLSHADRRVSIPMIGKVNSLNVATSAAIVAYEVRRQRRMG